MGREGNEEESNLPSPLVETKMKLILQAEPIEANKANLHSHLSLAHSCSCIQSIKHQRCEKVTAGEAGTIRRTLLSGHFDSSIGCPKPRCSCEHG